MRIQLVVAYDGTNFCGWQLQPEVRTVEGVLNEALSTFFHSNITVIGASRTDAGVHALGNIAVFDVETTVPPEKIAYAMNSKLPEDVRIQASSMVQKDFHPRHCTTIKTYEYKIFNSAIELPNERYTSYHVHYELNVARMREAAEYFVGTHDFTSFCSVKTDKEDKVRTIYSVEIGQYKQWITIQIRGNGFLYHMVRIIAGTLLQVGSGRYKPQEIPRMIEAKDRTSAGMTAPAKGLTLVQIQIISSN